MLTEKFDRLVGRIKGRRVVESCGAVEHVGDVFVEDEVTYLCTEVEHVGETTNCVVEEQGPMSRNERAAWALGIASTVIPPAALGIWFLLR